MTTAIVGHTGFVGGNLVAAHGFDELFNSSNVAEMQGREYDLVVWSAAKAEKWRANQDPEADARHIEELERLLSSFTARRLVLISTVDVYGMPIEVTEDTPVQTDGLHAYGMNRFHLEQFARERFAHTHVLRLPGLFGPGIKKNVIYDLLHDNNLDRIHADGVFQYYDLRHLWRDIERMIALDINLLNVATEPVATSEIAEHVFGVAFDNRPEGVAAGRYDMRSIHDVKWGGRDGYLYDRASVLADMASFIRSERNA